MTTISGRNARDNQTPSSGTNLIYLDIDGVLCTHRACAAIGETTGTADYLDPIACKLVERLISEFDGRVVISSTWRLSHNKRDMYHIFRCAGFHLIADALHDRWSTPNLDGYRGLPCRRGREIEASLSEIENHEHVTSYVIIDDSDDFLDYQKNHFVKCDQFDGIGFLDYEKARQILGGSS